MTPGNVKPANLIAAMQAWRAVIHGERVLDDLATLDRYGRTTQTRGNRPGCVIYPVSTEEVQSIVRTASEFGVMLHPISRGRNWGYTDTCPPQDGAVILDLCRMNRIVEVNGKLAYAVIEPGVSQGQLYDYIQLHHPELWIDVGAAGRDASIVGNVLERGFGHTDHGDHVASACGMEVVLADGRILRTGFGHYPAAKTTYLYRYGVGPFLDGLFCQSNFGIVTRLGVWLFPRPEAFEFFYVLIPNEKDLATLVDRLQPLRLRGILPTAVHIGNDFRILSAKGRYPWEETRGVAPLPDAIRLRMRKRARIGAWNAGGALVGTRGHVRDSKRALRKAVEGLGRVVFVNDAKIRLAGRMARIAGRTSAGATLHERLEDLRPVYGLLQGVPNDAALRGTHWRLRNPPSDPRADPLEAGAGLMWVSPVLPMTGVDARAAMDIVEPVFQEFGFEPLVTFTLINERAIVGVMNVAFDRGVPDETERAHACYDKLLENLIDAGYPPYRVGLTGMARIRAQDDVFWGVASELKQAFDPKDIISRGRYVAPTRED